MGDSSGTVRQVGRWLLGTAVEALRYPFQRVPLYRRDRNRETASPPDLERALPGDDSRLQRPSIGVGPLFHRRYWVEVTDSDLEPQELIEDVAAHLNTVAPTSISRFETPDGAPVDHLGVGDEIVVRLPGPWDGPVRVVERTATSFRLATLAGHVECGEIAFQAMTTERGWLRFEIESWARSQSGLAHVLYDRVPIARELQLHMWGRFCSNVAERTGGVVMTNVAASTRRLRE